MEGRMRYGAGGRRRRFDLTKICFRGGALAQVPFPHFRAEGEEGSPLWGGGEGWWPTLGGGEGWWPTWGGREGWWPTWGGREVGRAARLA